MLNTYKDIFSHYDTNNCGLIEPHQLSICISKLGFDLTPNTIKSIVDHYSIPFYSASAITPSSKLETTAVKLSSNNINNAAINNNDYEESTESISYDPTSLNENKFETQKRFKITFLQYVKCCAKLKALADMFHERDLNQNKKQSGVCSFYYEEVL